jgi:hypothetical protein
MQFLENRLLVYNIAISRSQYHLLLIKIDVSFSHVTKHLLGNLCGGNLKQYKNPMKVIRSPHLPNHCPVGHSRKGERWGKGF